MRRTSASWRLKPSSDRKRLGNYKNFASGYCRIDEPSNFGPHPTPLRAQKELQDTPAPAAPEARSLILMSLIQKDGDHGWMVEGES